MSASNLEVVIWFPGVTVCLLPAADLQGQQGTPYPLAPPTRHTRPLEIYVTLSGYCAPPPLIPGHISGQF